jgi:hypothetical protein
MLSQYIIWTNFPVLTDRTNALLLIETLWRTMDVATSKKTKRCIHCKQYKQLPEFSKDRSRKDGHRENCKLCHNIYKLGWKYNLSPEKYKAMLDSQNHCCADCLVSFDEKRPCIDHSHKCCLGHNYGRGTCGKCTRAIVCQKCNMYRSRYERKIDKLFASIGIATVIF